MIARHLRGIDSINRTQYAVDISHYIFLYNFYYQLAFICKTLTSQLICNVIPRMFNWVQVTRLTRSFHCINILPRNKFLSQFRFRRIRFGLFSYRNGHSVHIFTLIRGNIWICKISPYKKLSIVYFILFTLFILFVLADQIHYVKKQPRTITARFRYLTFKLMVCSCMDT